jgi:hypothetical protein
MPTDLACLVWYTSVLYTNGANEVIAENCIQFLRSLGIDIRSSATCAAFLTTLGTSVAFAVSMFWTLLWGDDAFSQVCYPRLHATALKITRWRGLDFG